MKRYPAFEPPEYRSWVAEPRALEAFRQCLRADAARAARIAALSRAELLGLYRGLVRARLLDVALKRWVLQGVISKAWLGTGEEAVSIGTVHALAAGDVVGPMIRNEAVCAERGMALVEVFRSYLGTAAGNRGRDLHHGSLEHGVVSPISHVGALVPVMAGMALAFALRGESRVALTYVGDGSTRTGEFHEGLSLAAARGVPLVVVIQDNRVALGTRTERHSRAAFESLAAAYGVAGLSCDGNNVLDVRAAAGEAVERARGGGGPVILVAHTFRMGGHATHDEEEGRRLFSGAELAQWGSRDPCGLYEQFLAEDHVLGPESKSAAVSERVAANLRVLAAIEAELVKEIEEAADAARASATTDAPLPLTLLEGVTA